MFQQPGLHQRQLAVLGARCNKTGADSVTSFWSSQSVFLIGPHTPKTLGCCLAAVSGPIRQKLWRSPFQVQAIFSNQTLLQKDVTELAPVLSRRGALGGSLRAMMLLSVARTRGPMFLHPSTAPGGRSCGPKPRFSIGSRRFLFWSSERKKVQKHFQNTSQLTFLMLPTSAASLVDFAQF